MLKRISSILCVALLAAYACSDRESEISRLEQELQQLQIGQITEKMQDIENGQFLLRRSLLAFVVHR